MTPVSSAKDIVKTVMRGLLALVLTPVFSAICVFVLLTIAKSLLQPAKSGFMDEVWKINDMGYVLVLANCVSAVLSGYAAAFIVGRYKILVGALFPVIGVNVLSVMMLGVPVGNSIIYGIGGALGGFLSHKAFRMKEEGKA